MRDGTPSGLSTMSTGVPSSRIRHVLDRHDARDHALVAVTAGHLVARLDLALGRDEDLDHLHHARRKFVTALQLVDLVDETLFDAGWRLSSYCALRASILLHQLVVGDGELPPLVTAAARRSSLRRSAWCPA